MSYLYDEIRQWPRQVSMGSIMLGKVTAPAPTSPSAALWVVLAQLVEPSTNNTEPLPAPIQVASWNPQLAFTYDPTTQTWSPTVANFPQVGDAVLLNFDDFGQLWALAWTPYYQTPVGAS